MIKQDKEYLKQEFHRDIQKSIKQTIEQANYRPTRFIQLIGDIGSYETAIRLLNEKAVSEGFIKLWEKGKLNLSVESIILNDNDGKYRELFDESLIKECEARLAKYSS